MLEVVLEYLSLFNWEILFIVFFFIQRRSEGVINFCETFPLLSDIYDNQPYFCSQSISLFCLEKSEDNDGSVAGQEDQDMPGSVQVGKPQAGPERTEDPVVDPADNGQQPE